MKNSKPKNYLTVQRKRFRRRQPAIPPRFMQAQQAPFITTSDPNHMCDGSRFRGKAPTRDPPPSPPATTSSPHKEAQSVKQLPLLTHTRGRSLASPRPRTPCSQTPPVKVWKPSSIAAARVVGLLLRPTGTAGQLGETEEARLPPAAARRASAHEGLDDRGAEDVPRAPARG